MVLERRRERLGGGDPQAVEVLNPVVQEGIAERVSKKLRQLEEIIDIPHGSVFVNGRCDLECLSLDPLAKLVAQTPLLEEAQLVLSNDYLRQGTVNFVVWDIAHLIQKIDVRRLGEVLGVQNITFEDGANVLPHLVVMADDGPHGGDHSKREIVGLRDPFFGLLDLLQK